jgi:sorbitol-specific phosphotransferase system component IIC
MPELKDTILAVLGASVSLAGLLLVFVGFLYSHAETFETKRRDRFRRIAKAGLIPFLVSLLCAWFCVQWLTGDARVYSLCLHSFRASMVLTAAYGLVTLLLFL